MQENQLVPELLLKQSDTLLMLCLHNIDTLNTCAKMFDAKILIFDKMIALCFLLNRGYACAWVVCAYIRKSTFARGFTEAL